MKPYKNIKSHNLNALLFAARFLAYIGWLVFGLGGAFAIISFVGSFVSSPMMLSSTMIGVFGFLPLAVTILLFSRFAASVVAFEENYRLRTEFLLKHESAQ